MSGKVIARPENRHECAPGWRTEFRDGPPFGPGNYAIPPDAREFRKGTVWECECGKTWVSTGPIAPNAPGFIDFRREGRWERRRRERRS
jgi:hypothetical protein